MAAPGEEEGAFIVFSSAEGKFRRRSYRDNYIHSEGQGIPVNLTTNACSEQRQILLILVKYLIYHFIFHSFHFRAIVETRHNVTPGRFTMRIAVEDDVDTQLPIQTRATV
jgi:hypothetical protein